MNLRYITCSDPREEVPVEKLIELLNISPLVEIGIQAQLANTAFRMKKFEWIEDILNCSESSEKPLNIAIHVNYQWCTSFCQGFIPPELMFWFHSKNKNTGEPSIKRWQLNIGDSTAGFDAYRLSKLIKNNPDREFIFPYNAKKSVIDDIRKLNATGAEFSLLYDSSYGAGISPVFWNKPAFENHANGYSGGLGPNNVKNELNKIKSVVPENYTTWIDAEGKLMKPNTREWDLESVKKYINDTLQWINENKVK